MDRSGFTRSDWKHATVIVTVLAIAGCSGTSARPDVQRLVDHYAPEIRIGERISSEARTRYSLQVAPYLGYRDSTYVGPDGVRELGVRVDEYVDDGAPTVSGRARVTEIVLQVPDTLALAAVRRRLEEALGAPRERCHVLPPHEGGSGRLHRLTWSGGGTGVVLGFAYASGADPADRPAGGDTTHREPRGQLSYRRGWLALGVEPSMSGSGPPEVPCS